MTHQASWAAGELNPAMPDFNIVFGAADVAVENSTCIVLSNGGDSQRRNYNITITEDGSPGFFATNATYPSYSLPLYLTWRDETSGTTSWTVVDGVEETQQRVGNLSTDCPGGGDLSYLEIEYLLGDYDAGYAPPNYAPAGTYTTTLTIDYIQAVGGNGSGNKTFSGVPPVEVTNPGSGLTNQTDTVVVNLIIEELAKVTALDDVFLDYTGWMAGNSLEVIEDFCVYTNDTVEQVRLTASTTTQHNPVHAAAGEPSGAGSFGLAGDITGETLFYEVSFNDSTGWVDAPANGTAISTAFDTRTANVDCTAGDEPDGDNMQVRVRVPDSQAQTSASDTYRGTLEILVQVPF